MFNIAPVLKSNKRTAFVLYMLHPKTFIHSFIFTNPGHGGSEAYPENTGNASRTPILQGTIRTHTHFHFHTQGQFCQSSSQSACLKEVRENRRIQKKPMQTWRGHVTPTQAQDRTRNPRAVRRQCYLLLLYCYQISIINMFLCDGVFSCFRSAGKRVKVHLHNYTYCTLQMRKIEIRVSRHSGRPSSEP